MRISDIKGIGEKTEKLFNRLGIYTADDLIRFYPRDYEAYEKPILISEIDNNSVVAIYGVIAMSPELRRAGNLTILTTIIRDENNDKIKLSWFNMPFLKNQLKLGEKFIFRGRVNRKYFDISIDHPEILTTAQYNQKLGFMQPLYPLTKGLSNKTITKAIKQVFEMGIKARGFADESFAASYGLMDFHKSVKTVHFPTDMDALLKARRRLVFDEFYRFLHGIKFMRENRKTYTNDFNIRPMAETDYLINSLPYELTNAQKKVLEEVRRDLHSETVMQRLIQGDVGSGKTIIAVLALMETALCGYQGALMVPTEVLARQHFESIAEIFSDNNIDLKVSLLTGSMKASEKKEVYEQIKSGEVHIVVGTHALIQEKAEYLNLALVITDEQHRFGVRQRDELKNKGEDPNVLVMSATPIPRTLALMLYGDLDISILDEMPKNRLPIKNCVVDENYRDKSYKFIEDEIKKGHQAYIICPMIEDSEAVDAKNVKDYTKELKKRFHVNVNIESLHGDMKPEEKNAIMERFAANEINILVSTTVIEVGINVPNATVMMIENSERFGLATLHQLRGRVGRGADQSFCIFVSGTKNEESLKKLNIINKSNDGFYIANEDLKTRGPGDVFGIRQSGELMFNIGDIYSDSQIMAWAKEAVELTD